MQRRLIIYLLVFTSLLVNTIRAQQNYLLHYYFIDKDSLFNKKPLGLQENFVNQADCLVYLFKITSTLHAKGYVAASVDSAWYDSTSANVMLFVGKKYQWAQLHISQSEIKVLENLNLSQKYFLNQPLNIEQLQAVERKLLDYYEDIGFPFARIWLDSVLFNDENVSGNLRIDRGPIYKIDSMRLIGNARIDNDFLQQFLDIKNGSVYRKEKLEQITSRLRQLPYLQEEKPWDMTMLGNGATVNLYLKQKRSSQVNGLVGFLPSNQQFAGQKKLLITGDFNLNLQNQFGKGENIRVNWQQIQPSSPRLFLAYQQPYLLNSPFGIDFSFDLLKKDSSYVNVNLQIGTQYHFSSTQSGKLLIQNFRTILLDVDTNSVKFSKRLPAQADVSTINLLAEYELINTNYRFNPRRGNELKLTVSTGTRRVKKNNSITELRDNSGFNYSSLYDSVKLKSYVFRGRIAGAHFFPLGKQATFKIAGDFGWLQSPAIFRNELFQLGGYRLLRGFDEESIFASRYVVSSFEYRYLIGQNSYLFTFTDGGWAHNKSQFANIRNTYIGVGFGMSFETKAGLFNISFAAGKRDDLPLNLRQAKIHFGYINFF
ncbi:MAG TPA: POTRA domain-containing protein [Chitinophagaceae bacterium]|nr:POTRA domain-containing protein [Chitinophagaceae bacterium]